MDIDASKPPAPLISIPLEVLLHIVSSITTPDYCNLRLTCRTIEAALLNSFAREFFTKRQFMLTEFSLQALVDISKSRFSQYINHVIIGLERPPQHHFVQGQAKMQRSMLEYISYTTLLNSGQDVEMMANAFANLPNLETIGLRDFNSRSRNRDWPSNQWRSYGYNTYVEATGSNLEAPHVNTYNYNMRNDTNGYLIHVFLCILRALAKGHSTPKEFQVILRHIKLYDQTFYLPQYLEDTVQPVLANFRTLFLDLSPYDLPLEVVLDGKPTSCDNYFLLQFLGKCSHLEHLRLNFRSYPERNHNDILTWLSKDKEVDSTASAHTPAIDLPLKFPQPVNFEHLRQLEIGMVLLESNILLAVVRKYKLTLRAISFHKVTLRESDGVDAEHRVNLWSTLFTRLSKLDLKLDFMNMSYLSQSQLGHRHHRPIRFRETRDPHVKKWAGTDIQSGLRDYVAGVMIDRLEEDTEVEVDEYEDSMVDDEDDEDHDDIVDDDGENIDE